MMVQFLPRRTVNNMLTFIFYLQRNITSRVYGKMFSPFPVIHKSAESETGARENHLCTFSFPHLSSSTLFFFFFFFPSTTFRRANESQRRGETRRGASHLETLDTGSASPPRVCYCLPSRGYGNRNSVSVKKAERCI